MTIEVFYEGKTEGKVCLKLAEITQVDDVDFRSSDGKDKLNKIVETRLLKLSRGQPIRFLILRDMDEGENEERILQSMTGTLQRVLVEREISVAKLDLMPHPKHANVYTLLVPTLDIRVAVHLATKRWRDSFNKSTIDDYVLELALRPNTVEKLAANLGIVADHLITKITDELPDLLRRNGIGLTEAKDYVRLYAAVTKSHTSPPVFAEKTMANADEQDVCEVFQPLIAAFEFVGSA
jgi:hypothetical protein